MTVVNKNPHRITYKVPWCAICNMRVDEFRMERDEEKGLIHLIAKCHGQEEVRTKNEHDIEQMETDLFFQDLKFRSRRGRDTTHLIRRDKDWTKYGS